MSPHAKGPSATARRASEGVNPLLQNVGGEMMGNLGEAGSAYLRGVVSLNREIAEFVNRRLERDAELSQALGKCKDWKEAAELQQNWFREASEEYAANAKSLMELTNRIVNETWAPLRQRGWGEGESGGD